MIKISVGNGYWIFHPETHEDGDEIIKLTIDGHVIDKDASLLIDGKEEPFLMCKNAIHVFSEKGWNNAGKTETNSIKMVKTN
jgi:hypothetical protein